MKTEAWKCSTKAHSATDAALCPADAKAVDMEDMHRHAEAARLHLEAKASHHIAAGQAKAQGDGRLAYMHDRMADSHRDVADMHKGCMIESAQGDRRY